MNKTFKILSIDGGGIEGLWTLYVLEEIEKKFCKKNETLMDYFDMICGTSTGGLIALGITTGKKISDIIKIYEDNAGDLFPNYENNCFLIKIIKSCYMMICQLLGSKYSDKIMSKICNEHFSEKKLLDVNNLLCIPAYCISDGKPTIFKYPHKEGSLYFDRDVLLKDVIISATAAPTYFPAHEILNTTYRNGIYADGGIWANNPTLIGIIEAARYFVGEKLEYKHCEILSLGNIYFNEAEQNVNKKKFWNLLNMDHFISTILNANYDAYYNMSELLCNILSYGYTRIQNNNFPYKSKKCVYLDNSDKLFINNMKNNAKEYIGIILTKNNDLYNKYNIQRFFKSKKTYNTTQ